jgi:hypothetical protein
MGGGGLLFGSASGRELERVADISYQELGITFEFVGAVAGVDQIAVGRDFLAGLLQRRVQIADGAVNGRHAIENLEIFRNARGSIFLTVKALDQFAEFGQVSG